MFSRGEAPHGYPAEVQDVFSGPTRAERIRHQQKYDSQAGSTCQSQVIGRRTGAPGSAGVSQPRLRDKPLDKDSPVTISPRVLPPYLRRNNAIEKLIPWLSLKGVSGGDFSEALQSLVGAKAKGLSANVIV